MQDMIYRQEAIRAFDDAGFCSHGYIVDVLEELPSAQPERPEQPESAREYCAECDHIEMCRWYPYEGCEFRSIPSAQPQACDDAISRDDAIMAVKTGALSAATIFGRTDEGATAYYETVKAIKALPSAQPERKKGKWILIKGSNGKDYHKCSECLHTQEITGVKNYCAVCGADMRGESE